MENLLTAGQAAKIAGVKPVTIRKYRLAGKLIPAVATPTKCSVRYLYTEESVRALVIGWPKRTCPTCGGDGVVDMEATEEVGNGQ
jgi:predicted site-specific integrase-resolvase